MGPGGVWGFAWEESVWAGEGCVLLGMLQTGGEEDLLGREILREGQQGA